MITIDLTTTLMPLIWALEGLLGVSATAIVGSVLYNNFRRRRARVLGPAIAVGSPAISSAVGR